MRCVGSVGRPNQCCQASWAIQYEMLCRTYRRFVLFILRQGYRVCLSVGSGHRTVVTAARQSAPLI